MKRKKYSFRFFYYLCTENISYYGYENEQEALVGYDALRAERGRNSVGYASVQGKTDSRVALCEGGP